MPDMDDDFSHLLYKYFTKDKILKRFRTVLSDLCAFSSQKNLSAYVHIDFNSLYSFVLYYFRDVVKIKIFHNTKPINVRKIYAYETYWFIRRHPLQIIKPCPISDINERFVMQWLISRIMAETGVSYKDNKAIMSEFVRNFFYHLKYRHYTPQSLEIMIEALYTGLSCIKSAK